MKRDQLKQILAGLSLAGLVGTCPTFSHAGTPGHPTPGSSIINLSG